MTYNFDPERWYAIERAALEKAYRQGKADRETHQVALDCLQQKLDALWEHLDGSYQLPGENH